MVDRVLSWVSWVIVPSCLRGYFVGWKYFLVGISWVPNFFSWVFCMIQSFFRGYFLGPKFFTVGLKLSLRKLFRNFQFLIAWEKVAQKYIWNCVFFSKLISTIVNSIYIRKVLHLLNYLCYYAPLVFNNCIFSHLFS